MNSYNKKATNLPQPLGHSQSNNKKNNVPYKVSAMNTDTFYNNYYPINYPADLPNTYLCNTTKNNVIMQETAPEISMQNSTSYPTLPVTVQMQAEIDLDTNYFKSLYTHEMKDLLLEVEKELTKLDYADSFIYDEFPDKTTMLCIADDIYNHVKETLKNMEPEKVENMQYCGNCGPMSYYPNWTRNLILMMLYNEILNRRRNYYYGLPW